MVTADGRLLTASAIAHADLFWAMRGSGGNFGVVTAFEYRLHLVSQMLDGLVLCPMAYAKEVFLYHTTALLQRSHHGRSHVGCCFRPHSAPRQEVLQHYTQREEFIYFLLIDRFHDDEPRMPVLQPDRSHGINTPNDFFGGKIKGITNNLSYIMGLGCTAI